MGIDWVCHIWRRLDCILSFGVINMHEEATDAPSWIEMNLEFSMRYGVPSNEVWKSYVPFAAKSSATRCESKLKKV